MKSILEVIWADSKTQKDVCKILDNAKKCTNQNPGYEDKVFDADGKVGYESKSAESAVKVLFLIKGSISDMNIKMGWERIMQGAVYSDRDLYYCGSEVWER